MKSIIDREAAARFIERQLNWETEISRASERPHYGARELRELMDFIYQGEPETESEKINIKGKGWN